ncbi:hypothetical protein AKJ64_01600 [candidate division MSBL1 archaeon SCGC-AAA259E17]|uniref:Uncharacterized protein n=1 Tax=candidate division MSBL1 archaeon SCGC-AAA259E17 TaxID=1698263 RepID=A0A133UFL7_9EURY|nr:hypothetical protein AKJ64_01600 [candidate division MSBL1 archaeon SCGC-AAA259E17]
MFEKDDSPWGFKPHRYECPVCKDGDRIVHISDMAEPYATKGVVCHLTFKCTNCFSTATHSIPVTEEYAEELEERRGESKLSPRGAKSTRGAWTTCPSTPGRKRI